MKRQNDEITEGPTHKRLQILTHRFPRKGANAERNRERAHSEPINTMNFENYKPSGLLEGDQSRSESGSPSYIEPEDKSTNGKFRLYTFEDHDDIQNVIELRTKSSYTIGRAKDQDLVLDDPGIADEHAVIQMRQVEEDEVRAYLVNFGSNDSCLINNKEVEKLKFVELLNKDTLRFGDSGKEFLFVDDF